MYTIRAPFRWIARWVPGLFGLPKRLVSLPLPKRVAVLLAIFLVALVVTATLCFFWQQSRTGFREYLRIMVIVVPLVIIIPIVTYYALRMWLEGDTSLYPDIDAAWQAGLEALKQNGLEIAELPLFFIIGPPDETHADNLMKASGIRFVAEAVPTGRAPLRWYANDRAIFLISTGVGCLSNLNRNALGSPVTSAPVAAAEPSPSITGTMVAGGAPEPNVAATPEPPSEQAAITGTLVPGGIQGTLIPGTPAPSTNKPAGAVTSLTRQQLDEETARLRYACDSLRRIRQPLCSHNGILAVLPLTSVRDIMTAKDMPDAIRRDLGTIRTATQLASSCTVLITGMEEEYGFSELVRRVGATRAKGSRFGKGFKVWNTPNSENLEALASEACGAFEDWVYTLFKEEDGFNKPGNGKLFSLLCTIRSQLRSRVKNIIMRGFSCEARDGGKESEPELFGGCYFAATGATSDRQAFVRSALDKVMQLEEDLEWTDTALTEEDRFQQMVGVGTFLNFALILCLIGLAIYAAM